ncbi:MAG: pilus assembly protein [Propionibacteriaceae bacterium]|nr:pilus assembly protein [Propionibacteriaceae bacterium]
MRDRLRDERGAAVTVWTVMVMAALTLIVGLAVDLSGQVSRMRLASDVAAQAARTAGQQLDADTYIATGGDVEVAAARAKAAAVNYAKASGMNATAPIESGTDLVVDVTTDYEPVFLSAFGIGTQQVTATARVRVVKALEGKEHR